MAADSPRKNQVVAVLGCGFMGTALLNGILVSTEDTQQLAKKYFACVRREEAADRLRKTFSQYTDLVEVVCDDNLRALDAADVVILGFQPVDVQKILGDHQVCEAVRRKIIISMLAGVSCKVVSDILRNTNGSDRDCRVVRVIPSIGAQNSESCSLVSDSKLSPLDMAFVEQFFSKVGSIQIVSEELMNTAVAISATTHALTVTAIDAIADGSVSRGVPRRVALRLAAQCLRSASGLLLEKMTLEELKDSMSVPRGITTEAWIHLDAGHVRAADTQSLRQSVDYAQRMA